MASLSTRALGSIQTFASAMGLSATPSADGSYAFRFRHSGALSITPADGDRLVMSLAWRPDRSDAAGLRRLLAIAGPDPSGGPFLHSGLAPDGSYVAAIALPQDGLDLPTLDSGLRRLLDIRSGL